MLLAFAAVSEDSTVIGSGVMIFERLNLNPMDSTKALVSEMEVIFPWSFPFS